MGRRRGGEEGDAKYTIIFISTSNLFIRVLYKNNNSYIHHSANSYRLSYGKPSSPLPSPFHSLPLSLPSSSPLPSPFHSYPSLSPPPHLSPPPSIPTPLSPPPHLSPPPSIPTPLSPLLLTSPLPLPFLPLSLPSSSPLPSPFHSYPSLSPPPHISPPPSIPTPLSPFLLTSPLPPSLCHELCFFFSHSSALALCRKEQSHLLHITQIL